MARDPETPSQRKDGNNRLIIGIVFGTLLGAGIGTAFGVALGHLAICIVVGAGAGLALGMAYGAFGRHRRIADRYVRRGCAYGQRGEIDQAIAQFNQAIRLAPNHAPGYYNRGQAYYKKREYERAIADYSETIRLNPRRANAHRSPFG